MMKNKKIISLFSALVLSASLSGCSTVSSAYEKTKDTVSGWFKSDTDKK
jgi:outer membrane protein assembly factor BamE (lipoprotein component of BamABCDE complex)